MPRLLRFIIRNAAVSAPIFGATMRRVSSPPGIFSTLMTSAPMSASIRPQVGPAITWHSSITLRPASGPCVVLISPALELRLGLGEERAVADLKILGTEAGVVVFQLGLGEREDNYACFG